MIEEKLNQIQKLTKKKKWVEASKLTVEIAEDYIDNKDFTNGLKYYEQAITLHQNEKKAEPIIVLYRKIISAARKGKAKTKKELFKFAAAAIPLVEEYIQVLRESKRYETKHGALTRYFLGECREIVSGVSQRDIEFLKAGKVFVKVGLKLAESDKSETESEEAFQKSRIIFDLMKNREETFSSFIAEAEISIRKYRLEKGFSLFEAARSVFQDEKHSLIVVSSEKAVFAEVGLQLLRNQFTDVHQREIAEMLFSKSRQAYLEAKSLNEFSEILFDIAKIYLENNELESSFRYLDEAISNSQLVADETIFVKERFARKILEYLYHEGKVKVEELEKIGNKSAVSDISSLIPMRFFDKIEEIGRQLNMGSEIEEIAMFIWEIGGRFQEKFGIDDFPYIEKAIQYLIRNNRPNGLSTIGVALEKRLDYYAEKRQMNKIEGLKGFLTKAYSDISDYKSAGLLNVKLARQYKIWGNHEAQIACLRDACSFFQNLDQESIKKFAEILTEHKTGLEIASAPESIQIEILELLGTTFLLLRDDDQYDSLYAQQALKELEKNNFTKAIEYHNTDFEFLKRVNNITRANARLEEMMESLFKKKQFELGINLCKQQTNLLIESSAPHEQVLQTIKTIEERTVDALSQNVEADIIDKIFNEISRLYTYLGLQEGLGDSTFEIASGLIEKEYYDLGFYYLNIACDIFRDNNVIEKVGILLDYASDKYQFFKDLADFEIADRFLDFLINTLRALNQHKEAAGLMMERAVTLVPIDQKKALDQFNSAKKLVSNIESSKDEITKFYQNYGSALLQIGNIEEGMEILTQAEGLDASSSLAIADICLNVAKDRFSEEDFDTYFLLVDRALNIYTKLEMFQESSSIALTEARKLWIARNLPYTMIFLERAWAPLSASFDEALRKSIKPIILVTGEIIDDLFADQKYDEAKNFLEFQERIYRHINDTEMILEVEKKKIDALIARGNIDGALSQVLDLASIGIEESKFNETIALIQDIYPIFFIRDPGKSKFLLKMYLNLLITLTFDEEKNVLEHKKKVILEVIDYYVKLILNSLKEKNYELYEEQSNLFFTALTELAEAEEYLSYFTVRIIQEMKNIKEFSKLFSLLTHNTPNLLSMAPEGKMKILNEFSSALENRDLSYTNVMIGIDILGEICEGLNNKEYGTVTKLLFKIGSIHERNETYEKALEVILRISERSQNATVKLNIFYGIIEENLEKQNYLNALSRLDEVIQILENFPNPEIIATKYIELINKFLLTLAKEKKKEWLDLFTNKYQTVNTKFLGKKTKELTRADEQMLDDQISEMLDFASKTDKKSKRKD